MASLTALVDFMTLQPPGNAHFPPGPRPTRSAMLSHPSATRLSRNLRVNDDRMRATGAKEAKTRSQVGQLRLPFEEIRAAARMATAVPHPVDRRNSEYGRRGLRAIGR